MKLKYILESVDYDEMKDKYKFIGQKDGYKVYQALDPQEYKYYGADNAYYFIEKTSNTPKYEMIMFPTASISVDQIIGDCYVLRTNFYLISTSNDIFNFQLLLEIPFDLIPNIKFITSPNRVNNGLLIENNMLVKADKNVKEVIIPNNITSIGGRAFYMCNSLAQITISDSVTSIGYCAFDGCNSLKDVYYAGDRDDWNNIEIGNYNDYLLDATIHYNSKINENFATTEYHQLYLLSDKNLNNQILQPRIPNNYLTKNGYEDNTTERVCFAPTIENCLTALSSNIDGKEFYVHTPIEDYKTYTPTIKEVPDRNITKEIWIQEPVKVKCIGKIKAIDNGEEGIIYKYGKGKEATLYTWDYEWID